jgi:hypothetical protein
VKRLEGRAGAEVAATPEEAVALLAAVERYPQWYPEVVREVDLLERDADERPLRVRAKLHLSRGPLSSDFDLTLAVHIGPSSVTLTRIPSPGHDDELFEVDWHVGGASPTRLSVTLTAVLDVPRLIPLGGIGDEVAAGFVAAAASALSRPR